MAPPTNTADNSTAFNKALSGEGCL